jgi:hypothetical protein
MNPEDLAAGNRRMYGGATDGSPDGHDGPNPEPLEAAKT